MTRKTITAQMLKQKGYKAFEFGEYTLEDAVNYIKHGCECKLIPSFTGRMVAVITIENNGHKYDKEMFSRSMTEEEKRIYKSNMDEEKKSFDKFCAKTSARNKAKMKRQRH